ELRGRGRRGRSVLPGEQAGGERSVGEKREVSVSAQWQLALLDVPVEQVVGGLIGRERRDGERPFELQVPGVAQAQRERLTLDLQRIELLESPLLALQRLVHLVEVPVLAVEAA